MLLETDCGGPFSRICPLGRFSETKWVKMLKGLGGVMRGSWGYGVVMGLWGYGGYGVMGLWGLGVMGLWGYGGVMQ